MRLNKKISIFLLSLAATIMTLSCSMEPNKDPGSDNDNYATATLIIGGTVYYDPHPGEMEPLKVEGLRVRIVGTTGITSTNQHGYFIINTQKSINRRNIDEYVIIEVTDINDARDGGPFATKTVDLNIGKLVEWSEGAGAYIVRNDPQGLNIFVERQ